MYEELVFKTQKLQVCLKFINNAYWTNILSLADIGIWEENIVNIL